VCICAKGILSHVMHGDDGVAGFFEDLPVLMFVLMGTTVLVISGAWVSRENAARELEAELDEVAHDITTALLGTVMCEWGPTPRVSSLRGMDILSIASRGAAEHSFWVTVALVHPCTGTIATASRGEVSKALSTGFACMPFNALDDRGLVAVMEARVIVW